MTDLDQIFLLEAKLKKTKNVNERIRLCAVLARANNHSIPLIASILRISESSVYEYLHQFDNENKTLNKPYPGRVCKMTKEQEEEIKDHVLKFSYKSFSHLCDFLKEKYGLIYTNSGLRDWLIRTKMHKKYRKKS